MINSAYEKIMENLQKIIFVWLVNNAENFLNNFSQSPYIAHKFFVKNYAAFHEIKQVLILNKLIYVGFTVDAKFLFTDRASLNYKIKSEDVYEKFF